MRKLGCALALTLLAGAAFADGDLSRADVQKVVMEMGTDADGHMFFKPNHFEFETGKAYAWVLTNTDSIKHELAIDEMRERIFTRKVEIETPGGDLVAEIKGNIAEVEVGPGQTVEWYFVPVQTAADVPIICELEGHAEAGMHGTVTLR